METKVIEKFIEQVLKPLCSPYSLKFNENYVHVYSLCYGFTATDLRQLCKIECLDLVGCFIDSDGIYALFKIVDNNG